MQLHVWGENGVISIISPECLASSWLLELCNVRVEIVTSCNTNISDIHRLPVLLHEGKKYQGYTEISQFIDSAGNPAVFGVDDMTKKQQLVNRALTNIVQEKVEYVNQYNLYINTQNYEKYTRKQFQKYFPFPMMYNQPLKFYNNAQAQIKVLGLHTNKVGFFSLNGGSDDIAETEYVHDDTEEKDQVPISELHERQLITKSKEKRVLREVQNSHKCLNLIDQYLGHFTAIRNKTFKEGGFGYVFDADRISTSEVLLYAYLHSLTHVDLPDHFVATFLAAKLPELHKFTSNKIVEFNKRLYANASIRGPKGTEIPSLWNEIRYISGAVSY